MHAEHIPFSKKWYETRMWALKVYFYVSILCHLVALTSTNREFTIEWDTCLPNSAYHLLLFYIIHPLNKAYCFCCLRAWNKNQNNISFIFVHSHMSIPLCYLPIFQFLYFFISLWHLKKRISIKLLQNIFLKIKSNCENWNKF